MSSGEEKTMQGVRELGVSPHGGPGKGTWGPITYPPLRWWRHRGAQQGLWGLRRGWMVPCFSEEPWRWRGASPSAACSLMYSRVSPCRHRGQLDGSPWSASCTGHYGGPSNILGPTHLVPEAPPVVTSTDVPTSPSVSE